MNTEREEKSAEQAEINLPQPATVSIETFSTSSTWFLTFTNFKVFKAMLGYVGAVLKDFFGLQFSKKFGISKIPLIYVDNALDKKVPFNPERIDDYLGFVNFWIRPLAMLVKILGRKKAAPLLIEFYNLLKKSYKEAAKVYRFCMTTTERPAYDKKAWFVLVHIFDPHYLCVPSLHIAVVSLCHAFFKSVLKSAGFSYEQRERWTSEIYSGAIKIAETVLYVKQHSVNCIPAALFMMTQIIPQYFGAEDAKQFLMDMFAKQADVNSDDKAQVVFYMLNLFERFFNFSPDFAAPEKTSETKIGWNEPIKIWIKEYAKSTNQENRLWT